MEYVEYILKDGTIAQEPCRRKSGTFRAYFQSREEAEEFAVDPKNPDYSDDVPHLCEKCGWWHLSRVEWLVSAPVPQAVN